MCRQRSRSWLKQEPLLRRLLHLQQECWHQRSQKSIQKRFQSFVCRSANGEVLMTNADARSPFVVRDYFLETAFELRFQGLLRSARQHRTWHVIAALRGLGKSLGIADLLQQSKSYKHAREATHNLAAPPHARQIGLCLVTAHSGKIIPLKEIFARPDILWRQFRRRLDTERPFCVVQGHTEEEVRSILIAFEDIYRSQFPDL